VQPTNDQETIELLQQQIKKLKQEREETNNTNIRESITDDIRYYQNQIDSMMDT
jgi:hypothetical protein